MSKLITFDIDGTLVHSPQMTEADWQNMHKHKQLELAYYQNLQLADPDLPGFFKFLQDQAYSIGIITARSMRDREITENFLALHRLPYEWLVVNMPADDRVHFLRSIKPYRHFDDHFQAMRYRGTVPIWYNDWPEELGIVYNDWPAVYKMFKYDSVPVQLSLF